MANARAGAKAVLHLGPSHDDDGAGRRHLVQVGHCVGRFHKLRRRLSYRPGVGELQRVFEVAQTVAATLDVEDVRAVEQAVEDGGGQDLVPGEQLVMSMAPRP